MHWPNNASLPRQIQKNPSCAQIDPQNFPFLMPRARRNSRRDLESQTHISSPEKSLMSTVVVREPHNQPSESECGRFCDKRYLVALTKNGHFLFRLRSADSLRRSLARCTGSLYFALSIASFKRHKPVFAHTLNTICTCATTTLNSQTGLRHFTHENMARRGFPQGSREWVALCETTFSATVVSSSTFLKKIESVFSTYHFIALN